MKNTIYALKELVCAFLLVCIFPYTCHAQQSDALDVFEEFASERAPLVCESFHLDAAENKTAYGKLKYTADEAVAFMVTTAPKKGTVELIGESGEFAYTPFDGQIGTDEFAFRITSANEESNIAICNIDIAAAASASSISISYADMHGHWGEYSAVKLAENDVIKGERIGADYYFYPDKQLSRIDAINIILSAVNAADMNIDSANTHIFEDSADLPDYINNAAYRAHKLGIIDGSMADGRLYLNPHEKITRIQLMKMIDRAMSSKTKSNVNIQFDDGYKLPDWSVQSVKNLVGYGVAHGYEDNTLRPDSFVTKAQAAQMIYQMIKYNRTNGVPTAAMRIKSGFYSFEIL